MMPNLSDTLMEDLDSLLDLVARISYHDEPQALEVLQCLDSFDYRKRRNFQPTEAVACALWNRPACQQRRRLELKGLSSLKIAKSLSRQHYCKASRVLYRCSCCTNTYPTWGTAVDHWQTEHNGPIIMFCMSCGHQLSADNAKKHQIICGWKTIDVVATQPAQVWLYLLQQLLSLKRREVCILIGAYHLRDLPRHYDTRSLSMYLFQHMRRAHGSLEASVHPSWQQLPGELRDRKFHDLGVEETTAAKGDLLDMINSIRAGKSLKDRELLVWDPDLFDDAHQELYRLQESTGEFKWVRLETEKGSMSLKCVVSDQTTQSCAKLYSGQCAPVPHLPSTTSICAELEGISTISESDSHATEETDSEGSSDVSSIAGSDTEHPYGAGYAWRSARRARLQTKPSRYRVGL